MHSNRNPYVGYQKDAGGVRSLWEDYNAGLLDIDGLRDPRHRLLVTEWQRCSALGVDVAMNRGRRLNEAEFERRRAAGHLLLSKSQPILQGVAQYLLDVPGIMILAESTGTILHVEGGAKIKEFAADRSGITEGSVWDEQIAGSNGIGSALTLKQPVHVYSSEHFCEGWHSWTCASAPILEPDDDSLLGVIDFTTIHRDYRDQALGLAVSLAKSIQAQIGLHRELERRRLITFFGECQQRYPGDDMIALDLRGRLLANSSSGRAGRVADLLSAGGRLSPGLVAKEMTATGPDGTTIGTVVLLRAPNQTTRGSATTWQPDVEEPTERPGVVRFGDFLTADATTIRTLSDLPRLSQLDVNVMLMGETGTGKELLARHLHDVSKRSGQPYLAVNCGAINGNLMESAFFGYVRGAFSGADPKGRLGYFEAAGSGTLFLDEIGELPLDLQASLLRVLEDGTFQRVGEHETRRARCRIVAATHRDLLAEVERGTFRRDLYYRLNVVRLTVLPLRQRKGDIPLLAERFLVQARTRHGLPPARLTEESCAVLCDYCWPGNVRELRNCMEFAALAPADTVKPEHLPPDIMSGAGSVPVPEGGAERGSPSYEGERQRIVDALTKYRKANRAAQALGMARSTLYRRFEELDIDPAEYV